MCFQITQRVGSCLNIQDEAFCGEFFSFLVFFSSFLAAVWGFCVLLSMLAIGRKQLNKLLFGLHVCSVHHITSLNKGTSYSNLQISLEEEGGILKASLKTSAFVLFLICHAKALNGLETHRLLLSFSLSLFNCSSLLYFFFLYQTCHFDELCAIIPEAIKLSPGPPSFLVQCSLWCYSILSSVRVDLIPHWLNPNPAL